MANQIDPKKCKFTFFLHKDVRAELEKMAEEESDKQGRPVTLPELIRRATLERANEHRKKQGKKLLDLDPSAGKFASWGQAYVAQVIVYPGGKIEAMNKRGERVAEWKRIDQLEMIVRLFPRVKIRHQAVYDEQVSRERKRA